MKKEALERLQEEMNQNQNNPQILYIGNYLKDYIEQDPSTSEKFLDGQKTIRGSLEKMLTEARKIAVNNCAMFTPEEGFKLVLDYFNVSQLENRNNIVELPIKDENPQKQIKTSIFDYLP